MEKWKRSWIVSAGCLAIVLGLSQPVWSADIYVSPTGSGTGAINDPTNLKQALDTADSNGAADTIYLQAGTYDASTAGADTFEYGSASNDEMQVTLSGSWDSSYTTQKTTGKASTFLDGGSTSRVLDIHADGKSFNFNIGYIEVRNGYLAAGEGHGAGLRAFSENSGDINLMLRNVGFNSNTSDTIGGAYGGGMYANSYFEMNGCYFTSNHATHAGALYFATTDVSISPKIDNCYFKDNLAGDSTSPNAQGQPSTISFNNSPIITNSTFIGDGTTTWTGSGLSSSGGSSTTVGSFTLTNCVFTGFRSWFWGGAVSIWNSDATITNCLFYDNYCGYQGSPSGGGGGAIAIYDPTSPYNSVTITNSTFVGNHTAGVVTQGGAIHNRVQTLSVNNSIFWDNGTNGLYNQATTATASFSDIQGGLTGTGVTDGGSNINTDPLFANQSGDPSTWDLQLTDSSPCVDTGDNTLLSQLPVVDLNANSRLWDGDQDGTETVDMGPYEYGAGDTLNLMVTPTSDNDCYDHMCDLQSALAASANITSIQKEIRLAQGTYTGNYNYFPVAGNSTNLSILGGWSSDFSARTVDPTNTILDGNDTGRPLTLNSKPSKATGSVKVEGLTIKHGLPGSNMAGGGLFAFTYPPGEIDIQHNIIEENTAGRSGGGILAVSYDTGSQSGGTINIANNIIRTNSAGKDTSQPTAVGGGIFSWSGGTVTMANNLIYDNDVGSDTVEGRGGGVFASAYGGGVYLTNNTVVSNAAKTEAGGLYLTEATTAWSTIDFQVYNNIIGSSPDCVECREDFVNDISETVPATGSSLTVSYNNTEVTSTAGSVTPTESNNITGDPKFVSETAGKEDFHLRNGSPCVDAGLNSALTMLAYDLEGETRPQDGDKDGTATVNMGCYETLGGLFPWTMFLPAIIGGGN